MERTNRKNGSLLCLLTSVNTESHMAVIISTLSVTKWMKENYTVKRDTESQGRNDLPKAPLRCQRQHPRTVLMQQRGLV